MVTRISGLASGMDIDSMVKQMLSVDRVKVDKVYQSRQKLEWKQQLYNDLNKEMANFLINARKNLGLSKTTSTGTTINTGLSSIGWHKTATSSDDTKLTATVSGTSSFSGTHSLEVKSLAEGVTAASTAAIGNIDENATTEGLGYSGTFKINGKEVTVETKDTLSTLAKKINSSGAGVKASYDSTLDRFFLQTNGVGASAELKIESDTSGIIADLKLGVEDTSLKSTVNTGTSLVYEKINGDALSSGGIALGGKTSDWKTTSAFNIILNGKTISIDINSSISQVVDKINNTAETGVVAAYDSAADKFSFKFTETGDAAKLNFTGSGDDAKSFIDSLKLEVNLPIVAQNLETGKNYVGMNGQVEYNGIATSVTSNNFTFNGVNFTAKAVGVATVTVATDTEAAIEKIKGFVEEYNKIVEKMGSVIGEKANRNYQPLTDEQKEAMSEKEIELWEERAKKGLLSRDETINRTLSSLRGSLYDKLKNATGTFSHISEIGITTEKYTSGSVGGKLAINEEKLRAALNSDADSVLEMLFQDGEASDVTSSGTTKEDPRGIFTRISDNLIDGMKNIIDRSGTGDSADLFRNVKSNMLIDFITGNNMSKQGSISMLDKDMINMSKQIDSLNTWLFNRENAYYARFTAMEKAMQQASSQSGWLMQQTGM